VPRTSHPEIHSQGMTLHVLGVPGDSPRPPGSGNISDRPPSPTGCDSCRGGEACCGRRHDFSARRARQPENCGKCHLGPDHPQREIYEESKHGVAYRDLRDKMSLEGKSWVLGKDYAQAATCATCHMSANVNGGRVTHDPGERISWTNRPVISLVMDTDAAHSSTTRSSGSGTTSGATRAGAHATGRR